MADTKDMTKALTQAATEVAKVAEQAMAVAEAEVGTKPRR